jgi:hypothetical protein
VSRLIFDHFTDGRSPWTSDQLVARPLPKHRTTQKQNKHIHFPNIHALSGIRNHDLGFRASEDSICHRPLGYRDRLNIYIYIYITGINITPKSQREILTNKYLVVRVPGYRYRGPGLYSRRYQIFWEIVSLERGPLSLVRITEELLERKVVSPV